VPLLFACISVVVTLPFILTPVPPLAVLASVCMSVAFVSVRMFVRPVIVFLSLAASNMITTFAVSTSILAIFFATAISVPVSFPASTSMPVSRALMQRLMLSIPTSLVLAIPTSAAGMLLARLRVAAFFRGTVGNKVSIGGTAIQATAMLQERSIVIKIVRHRQAIFSAGLSQAFFDLSLQSAFFVQWRVNIPGLIASKLIA
jgi:hypothetical protein